MEGPNNGIVLYHYSFSPYARRVTWYLTLRGIDYAECKQPPTMPRPDLEKLGIKYRRIPLMSIGRDVYCDTRLILRKLEERFPEGRLGSSDADQKALEKFLEIWTIEAQVFARAAQLIPNDMPLMSDSKFVKDREDFSGASWNKEKRSAARPYAMAQIRDAFKILETTLLADGREWILKTDKPTLADIEGIWVFDWLNGLKGALDRELISEKQFPKVFSWIARFNKVLNEAKKKEPKPATLKGDAAAQRILEANFSEQVSIDSQDPLKFQQGDVVEVWPTDSGFSRRDRGELVGLSDEQIVISLSSDTSGKAIRLHCPRTGFKVAKAQSQSSKL